MVHGAAPGIVGRVVALESDVLERQPDAGDLVGAAQGRGERAERARLQLDRGRDAILHLDRIDPRRHPPEQRFQIAHQIGEDIVRMDGMRHQRAAQLAGPLAAPGHRIIVGTAPPQRLDRAHIGGAGKARIDDRLGLLDAVAEPVLEHRHQLAPGALFGRHHLVDLGQRADQRLLADHVFARLQRRDDHRVMHHRRRADVDDVEIVHLQQFVEARGSPFHVELVGEPVHPHRIEVADRQHLELVGIGHVALDDMAAADPAADHRDREDWKLASFAHCAHTVPRSAICCATSASSIAL